MFYYFYPQTHLLSFAANSSELHIGERNAGVVKSRGLRKHAGRWSQREPAEAAGKAAINWPHFICEPGNLTEKS